LYLYGLYLCGLRSTAAEAHWHFEGIVSILLQGVNSRILLKLGEATSCMK
jgi:hypothetical protein